MLTPLAFIPGAFCGSDICCGFVEYLTVVVLVDAVSNV